MKRFLGILAGLVVCSIIIFLIESISHQIFPVPEGMNPKSPESITAYAEQLSFESLISISIAHFIGTLIGAIIMLRIVPDRRLSALIIYTSIMFFAGMVNIYMIPHPLWMIILEIILYPLAAIIAWYMITMRQNSQ